MRSLVGLLKIFRLRLHQQIKHALFAQILTELLPKIEQIEATLFDHVNQAQGVSK